MCHTRTVVAGTFPKTFFSPLPVRVRNENPLLTRDFRPTKTLHATVAQKTICPFNITISRLVTVVIGPLNVSVVGGPYGHDRYVRPLIRTEN